MYRVKWLVDRYLRKEELMLKSTVDVLKITPTYEEMEESVSVHLYFVRTSTKYHGIILSTILSLII
jgi:hypothetical protein